MQMDNQNFSVIVSAHVHRLRVKLVLSTEHREISQYWHSNTGCVMRTCFILSAIKTTIAIRSTHFYRPQTKLREGNVFTPVCWSFCSRGRGLPLGGVGLWVLGCTLPLKPPGHTPLLLDKHITQTHHLDTHTHTLDTYTPLTQTPQYTHPGHLPSGHPSLEMAIEAVSNQDVHNAELLV